MLSPDRESIFEEIEPDESCHDLSCGEVRMITDSIECNARCHQECPRARIEADAINKFIAINEAMLNKIQFMED